MLTSFLFFIAGAFSMRILQFILSINPNYYIFKHAEYTAISMIAEIHLNRLEALNIVKVCYEQTDRMNEFPLVENELNKRYNGLIISGIQKIKGRLPYKVKYDNLSQAVTKLMDERKENE